MRYAHRSVVAVALALALSACDATAPDTFPDLIGSYTLDALFRDALASDLRARGTMSFTHVDRDTGVLLGEADVTLSVTGEVPLRLTAFELGSVGRDGQITFRLHLPDLVGTWSFTGEVSPSGETMHGNHNLSVGVNELLGTWTAGRM